MTDHAHEPVERHDAHVYEFRRYVADWDAAHAENEARDEREAIQAEGPGRGNGERHYTYDDVARAYGAGLIAADEVKARAAAKAPKPYRMAGILTMAVSRPEVEIVIHPFGVRGQVVTLTANTGHGKSTFWLSYAFHHALNRALGPVRPESTGMIAYISAEDIDSTATRALALRAALRLTPEECERVDQRIASYEMLETRNPQMIAEDIRSEHADKSFDLVVVDTGTALFHGDDENDNTQLQTFAASCRTLVDLPGRPFVALLWHPIKRASADNLLPRGASSLIGTVDGNLTIWSEGDRFILGYTKLRSPHFEPITFLFQTVDLAFPSGKTHRIPIAAPLLEDAERDLDHDIGERRKHILLALDTGTKPPSVRKLAEQVGVSIGTIHAELKDMSEGRWALVEKDPLTRAHVLSKIGKRKAQEIRAQEATSYRKASDGDG